MAGVLPFLRRIAAPPGDATDRELLSRFVLRQDEAAFTALLRRHGPLVLGVCQRVLHNPHDAEDAFQATFLVLARKAHCVAKQDSLASWLHGVASRTALRARAGIARRREKERQVAAMTAEDATPGAVWADLWPVLDEEVHRLPEKYRVPFVLCYLQGKTNEEAARLLGCPKGTILSRLATARAKLRSRLTRRGIAVSAGLLAAALSEGVASAVLPPLLVGPTAKAALAVVSGQAATGLVSTEVLALMRGSLRAMLLSKLKVVTAVLLAVSALGTGGVLFAHRSDGSEPPAKREPSRPETQKDEEAIRGTWAVANLEQVNHEPTKDEQAAFQAGALKVVITADRIIYPDKSEATYQLDPGQTPKRIDLTVASDRKTVTVPGIYSLQGDRLKLCYGREGDRKPPASFDVTKAEPGTFPTCWTLRRDDPPPAKAGPREDAAAKELKAMAGDWDVVGLESGGRKASAEQMKGMRWSFRGSTMQPIDPRDESGEKAEVKLDPSRSPKHIDLVVVEGPRKGKTVHGIYKWEDGKLTICLQEGEGRPKDFTAAQGSNQGVIILEKVKW
jgi:RNA polymerase sigma factor (sigma-70 family)